MISLIRKLFYLLFFATPLVMFSGTSELFEFNKMILIYIATIIIVSLWLLHHILTHHKTLFAPVLAVFYGIFLFSQILATIFSIDIHTSLFGYYGRFNGGLLSIIAYLSLFFVFINSFDRQSAIKLLQVSLISSVIVMLWGLPGKFGHDMSCLLFTWQFDNSCWTDQFQPAIRVFSTLGQPNWLGAYVVINIFVALYFWVDEVIKHKKFIFNLPTILYTLYLFFAFTTVLFTRSRSALVALIIMLALYPAVYFFTVKRDEFITFLKKFTILCALFLISILIFKTGVDKFDKYITLPEKTTKTTKVAVTAPTNVTESLDIRKIVWQGAVDLGKKYPILGTGVETFAYSYYFTRPKEHNLTSEWDFLYNKAHNEYLNYFATTGSVGTLAYLAMIGAVIAVFIVAIVQSNESQHDRWLYISLLFSFLSILITNFFGFSTSNINLFFYILPGFIYVLHKKEEDLSEKAKFSALTAYRKVQYILVLVLGFWILSLVVRYYLADVNYAKAEVMADAGEHGQAAIRLQRALTLHDEHVYKDKLSYSLANLAFIGAFQPEASSSGKLTGEDKITADKYIQLAKFFNEQAIRESPKNVLYYKTTSKNSYLFYQVYLEKNYFLEAIKALQEAEKLAPTDPKLPYTIALFYSLMADEPTNTREFNNNFKDQSIIAINKSIELKPNYRDAYFLKGQLLKKYGLSQEANAAFNYILQNLDPKDQEAIDELSK